MLWHDGGRDIHDLVREAFDLENSWPRPCHLCIVSENGRRYTCGRCVEVPGICQQCGYLFAAEFGLLFRGSPKAIVDMVPTYPRYA